MTRDELNNAYFDWMYQLVCDDEYSRGLSYRKLLFLLHDLKKQYYYFDRVLNEWLVLLNQ